MSGLSALRRSGRFMVIVSRPDSSFCRTMSFMRYCLCIYWLATSVVARSVATKQSMVTTGKMDGFATLAMTSEGPSSLFLFLHQWAARQVQRLERLVAGDGRQQLVVVPASLGF